MRRILLGLVVATLVALGLQAPVHASTGGTADGDAHPSVGLILFYASDGRFRCSATLVTPTVLLTAAHCTDGDLGKVLVDFRSVVAEEPPTGYPAAADPSAGYTSGEITGAGFVAGTAHTHPDYSNFTDLKNWNDVGVIVLDSPVTDVPLSSIASQNTLDQIKRSNLAHTLFTAVGYGTEVRKPDSGPQKPTPMGYPLIRRYVDMPGQKLTDQILQTNGNPHDTRGTGGTCSGDSGGPLFYQGRIVAVTSYGYTENCRYLGGNQRVDIEAAQDWLAGFGVLAGS